MTRWSLLLRLLLLQDAVMQQFFGLVDTLLAGSPGAKQRRLGYRTYRVVPCSPLVGVLEWVEGTSPLTDYLLGDRTTLYSGGASARSVLTRQGCTCAVMGSDLPRNRLAWRVAAWKIACWSLVAAGLCALLRVDRATERGHTYSNACASQKPTLMTCYPCHVPAGTTSRGP